MYVSASNNLIQGNLIKDNSEEGIIITHRECRNNLITGNNLVNNEIQISNSRTGTIIWHNAGYRTENGGLMSVVNGSYVSHGLVATPTTIQLTPTGRRMVASIFKNLTHIQIGLWLLDGSAVTVPEEVYWYAEV